MGHRPNIQLQHRVLRKLRQDMDRQRYLRRVVRPQIPPEIFPSSSRVLHPILPAKSRAGKLESLRLHGRPHFHRNHSTFKSTVISILPKSQEHSKRDNYNSGLQLHWFHNYKTIRQLEHPQFPPGKILRLHASRSRRLRRVPNGVLRHSFRRVRMQSMSSGNIFNHKRSIPRSRLHFVSARFLRYFFIRYYMQFVPIGNILP
jgi:hypothetical protein